MKRGQSLKRKMSRGHVRMIWNDNFKRMDFYRKAKNTGLWILNANYATRDVQPGPGAHTLTLNKWEAK